MMSPVSKPPIFCDDCASLALANVDDAPLCAKCLQNLIDRRNGRHPERIEPLQIDPEPWSCEVPSQDSFPPDS